MGQGGELAQHQGELRVYSRRLQVVQQNQSSEHEANSIPQVPQRGTITTDDLDVPISIRKEDLVLIIRFQIICCITHCLTLTGLLCLNLMVWKFLQTYMMP